VASGRRVKARGFRVPAMICCKAAA